MSDIGQMEKKHETDVSAQQPRAQAPSRISSPDVQQEWPHHSQSSTRQGPKEALGVGSLDVCSPTTTGVGEGDSVRPTISRLKKRSDFLAVSRGRRKRRRGFMLQALRRTDGRVPDGIRVGFTCSKKVGNAVVRNRAKRRLRAASRMSLPLHGQQGWDYVLVGRPNETASVPFHDLCADLHTALSELHAHEARG